MRRCVAFFPPINSRRNGMKGTHQPSRVTTHGKPPSVTSSKENETSPINVGWMWKISPSQKTLLKFRIFWLVNLYSLLYCSSFFFDTTHASYAPTQMRKSMVERSQPNVKATRINFPISKVRHCDLHTKQIARKTTREICFGHLFLFLFLHFLSRVRFSHLYSFFSF